MTTFPILDLSDYSKGVVSRQQFLQQLDAACSDNGFFYLVGHGIPASLTEALLQETGRFFDLEQAEKDRMHIRHSAHFRGYSIMKNERDWREQVHFGNELAEPRVQEPAYLQLTTGPNLWPETGREGFRETTLKYMEAVQQLGNQLLLAIADALQIDPQLILRKGEEKGYFLMKMISYYAQLNADVDRPGVAPHCDWSWLTILFQDAVGGLEVLTTDGKWMAASPYPGALSVNTGELLAILTSGKYKATAHRVINPSENRRRISIPAFINPPLDMAVTAPTGQRIWALAAEAEHVHRVVAAPENMPPFVFGDSEWKRKGLGNWCYRSSCLGRP